MGPKRSKHLHNFIAMFEVGESEAPQVHESDFRQHRCCRYINQRSTISKDEDSKKRIRISKTRIDGDDGEEEIKVVREKIMFDLKTVADKMKDAILRKEASEEENGCMKKNKRSLRLPC